MNSMFDTEAWLYVIKSEGSELVKIGHTITPLARLASLQTGNPNELTIAWTCKGRNFLERNVHHTFREHRNRGEWFDLRPIGEPVEVVQAEVERLRRVAARRGVTARYFYED